MNSGQLAEDINKGGHTMEIFELDEFVGREQTIKSISEVVANIQRFNENLVKSEYLIKHLSSFSDWYYDLEADSFGPKKFVGFMDMTAQKYEALKKDARTNARGNFDSSLTKNPLDEFYRLITDEESQELYPKLEHFLWLYDKKPRAKATIYIEK